MHLRLHDIDAAKLTVWQTLRLPAVRKCTGCRYYRVENALEDFPAFFVQHRIDGHQVSNIPNQHETAPGQNEPFAVRACEAAIRRKLARVLFATFFKRSLERTAHQSKPVAVDTHFVFGVHGSNRVFAILNRCNSRLEYQVGNISWRMTANNVFRVRQYFDMQTMISQQERALTIVCTCLRAITDELARIFEPHELPAHQNRLQASSIVVVSLNLRMTRVIERRRPIQKCDCVFNDGCAAFFVV